MYVDPNWGDDGVARQALENALNGSTPDSVPTPFKTINGQDTTRRLAPLGAIPTLAVNGSTLAGRYRHVVVHLMPGLYGPADPDASCHGASGQRWNDDVFPVVMHDRIALQGTSALDTILDARHGAIAGENAPVGPILLFTDTYPGSFGNAGQSTPSTWNLMVSGFQSHHDSFVDSLHLRGCTRPKAEDLQRSLPAAAIYLHAEFMPADPYISNCVIADNTVGMAVLSRWNATQGLFPAHAPTLQNNTFVRNLVGFVDMDDQSRLQEPAIGAAGRSRTLFVNNLFDDSDGSQTPFDLLGVDGELLRVPEYRTAPPNWILLAQNGGYVNAFVSARIPQVGQYVNVPGFSAVSTTRTVPGMTRAQIPAGSRIEFDPWSVYRSSGSYFVYQRLAPYDSYDPVTRRGAGDHDLRTTIAPLHTGATPAPPLSLRIGSGPHYIAPLLDQGIDPTYTYRRAVWAHRMPPGTPGYEFHEFTLGQRIQGFGRTPALGGWDTDCEGHSNPRASTDPVFAPSIPSGALTRADIGADEVGGLVAVGFQPLTRQVHADRVLTFPPPGLPWPDDGSGVEFAALLFLSAPGRELPLAFVQKEVADVFPDCATEQSPHARIVEPLFWDAARSRYWCYRVVFIQPPQFDTVTTVKPSLLPDTTLAWEWQPQVLDAVTGHIHAPGFVAENMLRDFDGTNPGTLPTNLITGSMSCDSSGVFVALTLAPGGVQMQRHSFMSTGTSGQSVVLRR